MSALGLIKVAGYNIAALFIKAPIEPFWNIVLTYQLIALSPMMRINFPKILQKTLEDLNFFNGNAGYLRNIYELTIGRLISFDKEEKEGLFPNFKSKFLFENSPIFVTLLFISILGMLIFCLT